jgi:hypothetical protein
VAPGRTPLKLSQSFGKNIALQKGCASAVPTKRMHAAAPIIKTYRIDKSPECHLFVINPAGSVRRNFLLFIAVYDRLSGETAQ